jgi:hypothetical protein
MKLTAIIAKSPNKNKIYKIFTDGMDEFIDLTETDFRSSVKTWKSKPDFKRETKYLAYMDVIVGRIWSEDKVYRFISSGTSKRYAVMTPDFASKTIPGRIPARTGRGGRAFFLKKSSKPRPGIDARDFPGQIIKKRTQAYKRILERAVKQAIRAL